MNFQVAVSHSLPPAVLTETMRQACLAIPKYLADETEIIASKIFLPNMTTIEKIVAVETYFHDNYEYKIGIKIPENEKPMLYFLREKPAAHCEYFASAAALLLRTRNVPTRLIAGFVADEKNEIGDFWLARQSDAHAWVEAYDDISQTWVIVEATPPGGVGNPAQRSWLADIWDNILFEIQTLQAAIRTNGVSGLIDWLGRIIFFTWPGRIIAAIILLLIGRKFNRRFRLLRKRRKGRKASRPDCPAVLALHKLLAKVDKALARAGVKRLPDETLHNFALRIISDRQGEQSAHQIADWYRQYAAVRYNPQRNESDVTQLDQPLPVLEKQRRQN